MSKALGKGYSHIYTPTAFSNAHIAQDKTFRYLFLSASNECKCWKKKFLCLTGCGDHRQLDTISPQLYAWNNPNNFLCHVTRRDLWMLPYRAGTRFFFRPKNFVIAPSDEVLSVDWCCLSMSYSTSHCYSFWALRRNRGRIVRVHWKWSSPKCP